MIKRTWLVSILFIALVISACNQSPRDIRSPLSGGMVLTKDLTAEKQLPSTELNQTIEALAQNKEFKMKIVVAKGSPLVAEVIRQATERKMVERVQLVEQ